MMTVYLDGSQIADWDSFHDICATAFGFPEFYGRNGNARIDCVSYIDSPEAGMTRLHIDSSGFLDIRLSDVDALSDRCPEVLLGLVAWIAFVNQRFIESDCRPPIRLVLV